MDQPFSSTKSPSLREIETWVFDLDNTLYPASCGLFTQIDRKMKEFIRDLLEVEEDEAHRLQKDYFHRYGTTLRGLMEHHDVDPVGYLDYVHAIDFSPILANPDLDAVLGRLRGRKFIFTNGHAAHVSEVLARLGIAERFDGVFDITDADFVPKPSPEIYRQMLDVHDIDPARAAMVDDLPKNLAPAAELGMVTVWLRSDVGAVDFAAWEEHIHYVADDLVKWLEEVAAEGAGG
ncbi:MAG: pyrimidine 5'-nucleotidase [Alphaproteobacteria bacterium]|nr:pyrimidine 5'-nucleotidase [Alphaproteobacteria bacterium]